MTLIRQSSRTVLVCGSRDWADPDSVYMELQRATSDTEHVHVIHGDAPGADTMGAAAAHDFGYEVTAFRAEWDRFGKAAGPMRNLRMLDAGPDLVLAFGTGRGTDHTVREAEKRGIPVRRF